MHTLNKSIEAPHFYKKPMRIKQTICCKSASHLSPASKKATVALTQTTKARLTKLKSFAKQALSPAKLWIFDYEYQI